MSKTTAGLLATTTLAFALTAGQPAFAQEFNWSTIFGAGNATRDAATGVKKQRPQMSFADANALRKAYIRDGKPVMVSAETLNALYALGPQWPGVTVKELPDLLKAKGLKLGDPMYIRAFKESEGRDMGHIEIWMKPEGSEKYVKLMDMETCLFSGQLGPKHAKGDHQTPEGPYIVTPDSNMGSPTYTWSVDVGYPNRYDLAHGSTGSAIMIHGECRSVGCLAVGNQYAEMLRKLVTPSVKKQGRLQIDIFPYAMTPANIAKYSASHKQHADFWRQIAPAYSRFEETHIPQEMAVCKVGKRTVYKMQDAIVAGETCTTVDGKPIKNTVPEAVVAERIEKKKAPVIVTRPVITTDEVSPYRVKHPLVLQASLRKTFDACLLDPKGEEKDCLATENPLYLCETPEEPAEIRLLENGRDRDSVRGCVRLGGTTTPVEIELGGSYAGYKLQIR